MAAHFRLAAVAVALLACGAASAGDVYQWKDAKGVTHYSDAPPPKGQYQARDVHHRDDAAATATANGVPLTTGVTASTRSVAATTSASARCALARTNLDRLKTGGELGLDADHDGKADAPLSDDDRVRQTRLAEYAIRTLCTANPTP